MCHGYKILNSTDRKTTYTDHTSFCDNDLKEGWYRFQGDAGTRMPTTSVPTDRCGTSFPGWLNGNHPTETEGEVGRKVCFHTNSNRCDLPVNIRVKNCTSYYIYRLLPTGGCFRRYCGTDWLWHQMNSLLGNSDLNCVTWFDRTMNYQMSFFQLQHRGIQDHKSH